MEDHIVWDMPRIKAWIDAGADPEHVDACPFFTLDELEKDGMICLDHYNSPASKKLTITITSMGLYEVARLEAMNAKMAAES